MQPTDTRADVLARLRSGELSSLRLTEEYLARIETTGTLGCFVTVTGELALSQAAAADAALERGETLGPLHGLPVAVKDNVDVADVRTTMGSRFFEANVPDRDAEAVHRLRTAGAVFLGKTALHEFAYGGTTQNPHYGACRNPWDARRIPGGSSGGSGAAVAADLCAAALGTDTGGSVRIPAALNGVTALRPTTGRISNRGVFPITWTFDTVGPMARSALDVAALLAVLAGYDRQDPLSRNGPGGSGPEESEDVAGLRIGLPRHFYFEEVDADVEERVRDAASLLAELGAEIVEVDLPGADEAMEVATRIIWAEAFAIHRERLSEQPELFGEDVRRRLELGRDAAAADYAELRQHARVWRRTVEDSFSDVDLLLTPAAGTVAPLADEAETIATTRRLTRLTYGWSLAAVPVLALPCGFSSREGLPIAFQLTAAPWREGTLLRAGAAYQDATDWHLRRPEMVSAPEARRTR